MRNETVVISVGGSLIVPDQIDTQFLTQFNALIRSHIGSGTRFVIITGGGKTARRYQEAAGSVTPLTNEDLDWLGIHATRLNAHLLRAIFYDIAHPVIVKNPNRFSVADAPLTIAAGWRPGNSTDYIAVRIAKKIGAQKLVNLSNIDYVYDKDPRQFSDAVALPELSWKDFRALIPAKWDPGLSSPFDPVAAKEAQRLHLEVAMINGAKLEELDAYLNERPFTGTCIKSR